MIDLHTHSKVSDGSDDPGRIPELAAAAGCTAVALTDHDSIAGLGPASEAAERAGVRLIRGCEVSCTAGIEGANNSMHVLCYFVGDEGPLPDELRALRDDRVTRNRRLIDRLRELDIHLDYDALVADAGSESNLGRPHFAKALVAAGAATDIQDAFDKWLATGKPGYVPKSRLTPLEVARMARDSGAVAVMAHPFSLGLEPGPLERAVEELAAGGFGGLEAYYGRYSPEERTQLLAIARRTGLVATGGSDYHGTFKPDLSVGRGTGDLDVPDSILEELAARCG